MFLSLTFDLNLELLEVKILVIVCVWSPILLSCCTPKQCHLLYYILAICQFFLCLLIFNRSRNGSETTLVSYQSTMLAISHS